MSAIDSYRHKHIGWVRCPMRHAMFGDGRVFDRLPVYRLDQDVEEASDDGSISGRAGDILIGGGSGEASALRFSIPEVFLAYTSVPEDADGMREPPVTSHWTANESFMFGIGFEQLGWNPERQPLLIWLAEHLMAFLARTYPDEYRQLIGEFAPDRDGAIFSDEPNA